MAVEAINPAISHTEKKTGGKGKAWASVAIPGLGQFLDGRNKAGAGFLGGALALNIGNALAYRSLLKDAFTKTNNIESQSVDSMLRSFPKGKLFVIGALSLAIGIAIQNFPEGAIISMPLKSQGMSKSKAFIYGTLSGIVEPISAVITILLTNAIVPILPYLLAFAAGAMMYVVVEELIPESQEGEHSNIGTIGVAIGFVIMMILDVALG